MKPPDGNVSWASVSCDTLCVSFVGRDAMVWRLSGNTSEIQRSFHCVLREEQRLAAVILKSDESVPGDTEP